jgi:CBS-domain-containing membrane protein
MLALAIWQYAAARKLNLTIVLGALYLMLSGPAERRSASSAELMSLLSRRDELKEEGMLPLSWIAASRDVPCQDAMRRLRARRVHRIAVYDGGMRLMGVVEERDLIAAVRRGEPETLGDLAAKRTSPVPVSEKAAPSGSNSPASSTITASGTL